MRTAELDGRFGVVMIGVAQEKTSAWRGFRRGGSDSHPHFCQRRMSVFPNHFHMYIRDREFGPAFIKTCAYAPYGIWIYLNGHEWAKRQAGICDTLYYRDIERFWEYWQQRLPSPFTAEDRERGYGYQMSVRQLELSDTRVFQRPSHVRHWFELMLTDRLALGRPDNAQIVFGRKITSRTPGHDQRPQRLRRRQNAERHQPAGAHPHWPRDQRAAPRRPARRLRLRARLDHPAPGRVAVDPRRRFAGLTNKSLRELIAGLIPGYSARQMTYDLRRLRRKGLIRRVPRSQRYEITDHGRRIAAFFTKTYTRILNPALAELDPSLPDEIAQQSPLARAWHAYEHALDARINDAQLTCG
jgi:hypothetical protein